VSTGLRRFIAGILITIAAGALTLSAIALWTRGAIVKIEGAVALGETLVGSEPFRVALSEVMVTRMLDDATPAVEQRRPQIIAATETVLATDEFAGIMGAAFGQLHEDLLAERRAELDVSRAHALIIEELSRRGMEAAVIAELPPPSRLSRIVTLPDTLASAASSGIESADRASVVVPLIALAALAGGLLISPRRWRSLMALGILTAFSAGATLIGLVVMGFAVSHQTSDPAGQEAAGSAWSALVGGLRTQLIILIAIGAAAAVGGFAVDRARNP